MLFSIVVIFLMLLLFLLFWYFDDQLQLCLHFACCILCLGFSFVFVVIIIFVCSYPMQLSSLRRQFVFFYFIYVRFLLFRVVKNAILWVIFCCCFYYFYSSSYILFDPLGVFSSFLFFIFLCFSFIYIFIFSCVFCILFQVVLWNCRNYWIGLCWVLVVSSFEIVLSLNFSRIHSFCICFLLLVFRLFESFHIVWFSSGKSSSLRCSFEFILR